MKKNWRDKALCSNDKNSEKWFSYNIDDIQYAKSVCKKCTVRLECITNALSDGFYGVNAGISEYDYKLITWKEAGSEDESNWSRSNKTLQRVLREAK
jgi:hypothetical protein